MLGAANLLYAGFLYRQLRRHPLSPQVPVGTAPSRLEIVRRDDRVAERVVCRQWGASDSPEDSEASEGEGEGEPEGAPLRPHQYVALH